ncbi:MAG: mandelate racemase/muconate lactonizing enzyme family protein [Alphaproteobacteria bacterium]|nr:MAG: mandelate racemase/muconate lactonizing enzyme family protein [Alphaproteobacteria bacterium]
MAVRVPIAEPVVTAFGVMTERPMVLIAVEDRTGAIGWGEVWCNFPSVGAEHRAALAVEVLAPLLADRTWQGPAEAFVALTRRSHALVLQSGEVGPFAQTIAGLDQALWDLAAQHYGTPLWRALGGRGHHGVVRAYASGINPAGAVATAVSAVGDGFRAVKLKLGFGRERDLERVAAVRAALPASCELFTDANQAWDLPEAAHMSVALADLGVGWLEEPMPVDSPLDHWRRLAYAAPLPLAGGENLRGAEFDAALSQHLLTIVQPDVGKWGGVTGCLRVAQEVVARGLRYCPHWLGGGIGLAHSAHLLAAVGGDGWLEVDCNPNPLRTLVLGAGSLVAGDYRLPASPGLGMVPDLPALTPWITAQYNRSLAG